MLVLKVVMDGDEFTQPKGVGSTLWLHQETQQICTFKQNWQVGTCCLQVVSVKGFECFFHTSLMTDIELKLSKVGHLIHILIQ